MCNAWNHSPGCNCGWGGQGNPENLRPGYQASYGHVSRRIFAVQQDPYDWVQYGSITFHTECWWCGEEVYFHRNENGGCVLFDSLGPPWPVHACWEEYKHQHSEAVKSIIAKHILQLKTIRIEHFKCIGNELKSKETIEGFILGFDASRRVLPNSKKRSDPDSFLRYLILKTIDGKHIIILVPEKFAEKIVMCSYATIDIECHMRGGHSRKCFARSVRTRSIETSETQTLNIEYNYLRILNIPWTHQTDLTYTSSKREKSARH